LSTPEKFIYTYDDFNEDIQTMITVLKNNTSLYANLHIVTPYRGGLPLGVTLSNKLQSPLSILKFQRYDGKDDEVTFMHNAGIYASDIVVLVDDLVDAGVTMEKCHQFLKDQFPNTRIIPFTLFGSERFTGNYVKQHPGKWIVFPWE